MIIGFCGMAGSGKDTAADFLVKNSGFVKVAFADPLKRICQQVYDFTDDQLWGPSASRNAPDFRYPRTRVFYDKEANWVGTQEEYLTPRLALQLLGTEWGRACYPNTWVDLALRIHDELQKGDCYYDTKSGIRRASFVNGPLLQAKKDVVISDVRFINEVEAINKAGGLVYQMTRGMGLEGAAGQHQSETEMHKIPKHLFEGIIDNQGWSLEELESFLVGKATQWRMEKEHARK